MTGKPIRPMPLRIAHVPNPSPLTAAEAAIGYLNLPTSRPPIDREDGVHVFVRDGNDFAAWVHALGGEIKQGPALDGASLWTLRTQTPRRVDGSSTELRVHVALVVGEFAPGVFRGAVSA
ncbi:hypothetical protein [Streptomyces violarus]|uniref:hypothetical protein n=1 Tax=Streptomyces violarus TaxID=67380 RepID=UPI0021C20AC3|nr:hypothetical protein [Streptomyces violarus]MCT9139033.1 hypothetical protein [Streptomyces violarus]